MYLKNWEYLRKTRKFVQMFLLLLTKEEYILMVLPV